MRVQPTNSKPLGFLQLTGLSMKKGFDGPGDIPAGAAFVLLQAEGQDVRWRDDGTFPTAAVGMVLTAGDPPFLYDGDLAAIEFIEVSASAKVNAAFYGLAS
jgi:predicted hotdog family 3-hydroxylacyl-ACP dehydratase